MLAYLDLPAAEADGSYTQGRFAAVGGGKSTVERGATVEAGEPVLTAGPDHPDGGSTVNLTGPAGMAASTGGCGRPP